MNFEKHCTLGIGEDEVFLLLRSIQCHLRPQNMLVEGENALENMLIDYEPSSVEIEHRELYTSLMGEEIPCLQMKMTFQGLKHAN
jgi:hypothetical protein